MRLLSSFRGAVCATALAVISPALAAGENLLFPTPLHLTREITDPISRSTQRVEEYYANNRVVSVAGEVTVIVDHAKQQITRIDRALGTYSVETFADVAKRGGRSVARRSDLRVSAPRRLKRGLGEVDVIEAEEQSGGALLKHRVAFDRTVVLTAEEFGIITGSAFPAAGHNVLGRMAETLGRRDLQTNSSARPLPLLYELSFSAEGEDVLLRSEVVRVGGEVALAAVLTPPPGARRVAPQDQTQLADELDRLPTSRRGDD